MLSKQRTIAQTISFSGKGLHTGELVTMTIRPAEADSGIVFRRIDLKGTPEVAALAHNVTDTSRGTTIKDGKAKVSTIEHILSALWTMGIDNALIDINAPETPIMDGSAKEYAAEIERVGTTEQEAERRWFEVEEEFVFEIPKKGTKVVITPAEEYSVSVTVDYNSTVVGVQQSRYDNTVNYREEIAPCRTFVFLHEIELLLKLGLIKGGSVESAMVVVEKPISESTRKRICKTFGRDDIEVEKGYLTHAPLRFENEIARHKLLDILGDLALLGRRIKGHVEALRPGHYANTQMAQQLEKKL